MAKLDLKKFTELAPQAEFEVAKVRRPEYGRLLEDFEEGAVFRHPRGFTIDRSFAQEFATCFHDACPLFLSAPYAQAHGFSDLLVSPLHVFNIVLSLGVQNNSEKAVANLGYYNVRFIQPVYPGDTLTARTEIISRRERGPDKPGIVHVRTLGFNQKEKVVIQYERKIMISPRGKKLETKSASVRQEESLANLQEAEFALPKFKISDAFRGYTTENTYFENFEKSMVIVHKNMRTITDEHIPWTYRMGNTHPLHYDRIYSRGLSGKMSGEPIVYGGLVFAWLVGLASRDTTENMLWDLGYTEGYHTQPAISGDSVGALSRVLDLKENPEDLKGSAMLQLQLIGVKNIATGEALDKYGAELFIKENDKKKLGKEKIPEKIFEIERQILVKKAPQ